MNEWLPRVNQSTCTGCRACVQACPTGALTLSDGKAALIFPDHCTYCAACDLLCPVGAIELPYLVCRIEDLHESSR